LRLRKVRIDMLFAATDWRCFSNINCHILFIDVRPSRARPSSTT
jgi:hypothetical protein